MITINMQKAKNIAHAHRRIARTAELTPYDEIIAKQIPGKSATEAEGARQGIRDKYAEIQNDMNAAKTPEELAQLVYSVRPELEP